MKGCYYLAPLFNALVSTKIKVLALVIKLSYLGIEEEISLSDKDLLRYINDQDFKTRLEFAIGIDIESHSTKDQLEMLAAYTNKLMAENLNPAQINGLRAFLQDRLNELP